MAYIAEMARKSQVARTRIRRAAKNVAPSRAARKRSPSRAAAGGDTPYHHGALHDALLEAASDPGRLRRFGEAARARVEAEFTPARAVEAYERLWAGVLGLDLNPP